METIVLLCKYVLERPNELIYYGYLVLIRPRCSNMLWNTAQVGIDVLGRQTTLKQG